MYGRVYKTICKDPQVAFHFDGSERTSNVMEGFGEPLICAQRSHVSTMTTDYELHILSYGRDFYAGDQNIAEDWFS